MDDPISRFYLAIDELQESINSIETTSKYLENHKNTLLFNLIEMMAHGVYGNDIGNGNRIRFERFIISFCGWEDADRVSIQQLVLLLKDETNKDFDELKVYSERKLSKWPLSQPVLFNLDPKLCEIKKEWPNGLKLKQNITPEHLQHVNLMWKLRNSLTHEMRNKSLSIRLFTESRPHYVPFGRMELNVDTGTIELKKDTWLIYYPPEFLNNLLNTAKIRTREYLEHNNINPIDNFNFDPSWV